MLDIEEVAANVDSLGVDLDEHGLPTRPVIVVDADSDPTRLEQALVVLRRCRSIIVVVSRGPVVPRSLAVVADVSLVAAAPSGDQAVRRADRVSVAVQDPLAASVRLAEDVRAGAVAALSLAWLLRGSADLPVEQALATESSVYSMLLAGRAFGAWLVARGPGRERDAGARVLVSRDADVLSVVLNRPGRRNAVDAAMRDELREALQLAAWDPSLQVELSGAGPGFSAGGDLDEFGRAGDVASAHVLRVEASPALVLDQIKDRVTVRVHGTCLGAGVELPAFAGRVVADPGTTFGLPEVSMGLIPGAGGTVSIPRRIGRQRTLWMALTGTRVDAATALAWGLVDALD